VGLRLTALNRYPVKSCRGEAMHTATIEPWGLAGDRRWMLIDDDGEAATAREFPRLLLAVPELIGDGLMLHSDGMASLHVATPRVDATPVTVHGRGPWPALLADAAADAWFSTLAGTSLRLVFQDDPTQREANPAFAAVGDHVSLADSYPMLLTTTESLVALNEWIAAGPLAYEGPLPMARFRPNLVVTGAPAWAEDGWRRLRIGAATVRLVKGCDRCVLTTTDPWTAARGKEPIATLARHRRWEGATWFGMNVIPDTPGATISVDDDVEIVQAVPAPDGPPR
jgi:hypothetical protein